MSFMLINQAVQEGEAFEIATDCQFDKEAMQCEKSEVCKSFMKPHCPLRIIQNSIKFLEEK